MKPYVAQQLAPLAPFNAARDSTKHSHRKLSSRVNSGSRCLPTGGEYTRHLYLVQIFIRASDMDKTFSTEWTIVASMPDRMKLHILESDITHKQETLTG